MNLKAISPVIATVIIVSVAIAIAVAVAFWMTGITGLFTRYEKLEIVSAYATTSLPTDAPTGAKWMVKLTVRNTGTTDVTIDDMFINGKPLNEWSGYVTLADSLPTLTTGQEEDITLYIKEEAGKFTSGQIIEIKLHTAAGNEYPKSVQLP